MGIINDLLSGVRTLRKSGATKLAGDIALVAGSNVTLTQDDTAKTITIAASSGGGTLAGDVSGAIGSNTVDKVKGAAFSMSGAADGKFLARVSGTWSPVAAAGDVSGAPGSLSVDKIKGRSVSSSAPSTGQVLTWSGSEWAPATPSGGGAGGDLTTFFHWARRAGILWTPAAPGGSYTTGIQFKLFAPMQIGGAAFWDVSSGSGTRRVSVWKGTTLVYTEDFPVSNGTNFVQVTFATPVDVVEADLDEVWTIGIWDTSGAGYTKVVTAPPANFVNTLQGAYFEYVAVDKFISGDNRPVSGAGTECYPIEPTLRAAA